MSMLSMQIDRLRRCADLYDGTTKPEMAKELQRPYLAQELRKAADTIWELRDDLQQANAENAKLQIDRDEWRRVAKSKQDIIDHMRDARAENAKLRELARGLGQCAQGVGCEDCLLYDRSEPDHCREERLSRELGIEVDG